MRLIDADAAIKDARQNYGDVHDAVLMKHFLNSQPTIPSPTDDMLADYKEAIADIYHMGGCPNCKKNLGRSDRTGLPICADGREYPNGICFEWRGKTPINAIYCHRQEKCTP